MFLLPYKSKSKLLWHDNAVSPSLNPVFNIAILILQKAQDERSMYRERKMAWKSPNLWKLFVWAAAARVLSFLRFNIVPSFFQLNLDNIGHNFTVVVLNAKDDVVRNKGLKRDSVRWRNGWEKRERREAWKLLSLMDALHHLTIFIVQKEEERKS